MIRIAVFCAFTPKLTKVEHVLYLETKRGRGHNISLNENQAAFAKALTCDLCSKVYSGLLSSLRLSKGGFETMVST